MEKNETTNFIIKEKTSWKAWKWNENLDSPIECFKNKKAIYPK